MAQVDIKVNGRVYRVACDDGQERRLHQLADHIDGLVADLSAELGQIGEARLILLAALTACDELFDLRQRLLAQSESGATLDADTLGGASRVVEAAAQRIEAITERVARAS
jgi:cell division protein ZapA